MNMTWANAKAPIPYKNVVGQTNKMSPMPEQINPTLKYFIGTIFLLTHKFTNKIGTYILENFYIIGTFVFYLYLRFIFNLILNLLCEPIQRQNRRTFQKRIQN